MRSKAGAFLFLLLMGFTHLCAQEDGGEDNWDIYESDMYTAGDQTFTITLGTVFPTVFLNNGKKIEHNFTPPVGGIGSLSYNFFLNYNVFVGGEVNGIFIPTLGTNTLFVIPLGIKAGYQFYLWRFEFPVSAGLGMAWHRYLNDGYYGFYMKGGAAAYFRFNPEWSFGLNTNWYWLPQWTEDKNKNVDGNFIEVTLSARYHF